MSELKKLAQISFLTGIIVFLIGNWFFSDGFDLPFTELLRSFLTYQLFAFVLTFANSLYFDRVKKWFPDESRYKKRILVGFSGSVLLTLLLLFVLRFVVVVLIYGGAPESFLNNSKGYFIFGLIITVNISLLIHVIYFYKAFSETKVAESEFVARTESARFESLKSQIDPHFLFNSLNVLASLIGEDPDRAERFTTKLSRVYRYVLEQKDKELVPLDEELHFARDYMELLKMRFEDAIFFEIPEKAVDPEMKIVPLSLQILLENTIKHNAVSTGKPLKIEIYEKDQYLVVANEINPRKITEKSTNIGLNNIRERYRFLTDRLVKIENNSTKFKVSLPLLLKAKQMKTSINNEVKYEKARKKVEAIKEFYFSLATYAVVIPFLIFIWYKYTPHTIQWFWFPMIGWGIGLLFQGLKAFGNPVLGEEWEQRKIRELMEKDKTS